MDDFRFPVKFSLQHFDLCEIIIKQSIVYKK